MTGDAYVGFGTNAPQVAAEIAAAMARIQASLNQMRNTGTGKNLLPEISSAAVKASEPGFRSLRLEIKAIHDEYARLKKEMETGLRPKGPLGPTPSSQVPGVVKRHLPEIGRAVSGVTGRLDPKSLQEVTGQILQESVGQAKAQVKASRLETGLKHRAALKDLDEIYKFPTKAHRGLFGEREANLVGEAPAEREARQSRDPYFHARELERLRAEAVRDEAQDLKEQKAERARALSAVRQRALGGLRTQEAAGGAMFAGKYARDERDALFEIKGLEARRLHDAEELLRAQRAITKELAQQAQARQRSYEHITGAPVTPGAAFVGGLTSRGFTTKPRAGDFGEALTGLAGTAGNVAKYAGLYQALNLVQQGMAEVLRQTMDFQDSLADLNIAMADSGKVTNSYINELSELSRLSGSNVGAAMDSAARGIRVFGDEAVAAGGKVENVGTSTAKASTMLALIAEKDLKDATGDVIAIGSAFGLTGDQLNVAVDAVANAKRTFGGAPEQISQGLASIAVTAKEAGFSVGEAANMISLVISRTDESGQAAATRLSRIFAIISGTHGQAIGRELGIDTAAPVREQLNQIAGAYEAAAPEMKGRIRTAFGGTANLRELIPLLDPENQAKIRESLGDPGVGADEFYRKLDNLVGMLKQLAGTAKNLAIDLSRTGIFTPLAIGLKALEPMLRVVDDLLKLYIGFADALGPLKSVVTLTLELAVALRIIRSLRGGVGPGSIADLVAPRQLSPAQRIGQSQGAAAGAAVGGVTAATAARLKSSQDAVVFHATRVEAVSLAQAKLEAQKGAVIAGSTKARQLVEAENVLAIHKVKADRVFAETAHNLAIKESAAARRLADLQATGAIASGGRSFKAGLSGLLGLVGGHPAIGAAVAVGGAAVLASNVYRGGTDIGKARESAARQLTEAGQIGGSPEALRNASQSLLSSAAELDKSQKGLTAFLLSPRRRETLGEIRASAGELQAQHDAVEAERALAAQHHDLSVFGDAANRSVESLNAGLEKLHDAGVGATESTEKYWKAVTEVPDQSKAGTILSPAGLANNLANSLQAAVDRGQLFKAPDIVIPKSGPIDARTSKQLLDAIGTPDFEGPQVDNAKGGPEAVGRVREAVSAQLKSWDIKSGDMLTEPQLAQLTQLTLDAFGVGNLETLSAEHKAKVRTDARNIVNSAVDNSTTIFGSKLLDPTKLGYLIFGKKDEADPAKSVPGLAERIKSQREAIPSADIGPQKQRVLGAQLKSLHALRIGATGENLAELNRLVDDADSVVSEATIEWNQMIEAHQLAGEVDPAKRQQIRVDFLKKNILAAGERTDLLLKVMNAADADSLASVDGAVMNALKLRVVAAKANLEAARQVAAFGALFRAGPPGAAVAAPLPTFGPEEAALKSARGDLDAYTGTKKVAAPAKTAADAANILSDEQKKAMRQQAAAALSGDKLKADRAAVSLAHADVVKAQKDHGRNSKEFLQASMGWAQARRTLSEDVLANSNTLAEVFAERSGDEVRIARQQLVNARRTAALSPHDAGAQLAVVNAAKASRQAEGERVTLHVQLAASRRVGGPLSAAQDAINLANVTRRYATSVNGKLQAQIQLNQAEEQMRQAQLEYASILGQLSGDITNPIEQAKDALNAARNKLSSDTGAGADKSTLASDRLGVRQAEAALERTKFSQRLSDVQTNHELGRISFQAYMRYLNSEHDRFTKIKARTFDQQQALNEIDKAIKAANDQMQGQFNLGDIKLPTAYQARRAVGGDGAYQMPRSSGVNQQISIAVNGADIPTVTRVLTQLLGPGATVNSTHKRKY